MHRGQPFSPSSPMEGAKNLRQCCYARLHRVSIHILKVLLDNTSSRALRSSGGRKTVGRHSERFLIFFSTAGVNGSPSVSEVAIALSEVATAPSEVAAASSEATTFPGKCKRVLLQRLPRCRHLTNDNPPNRADIAAPRAREFPTRFTLRFSPRICCIVAHVVVMSTRTTVTCTAPVNIAVIKYCKSSVTVSA